MGLSANFDQQLPATLYYINGPHYGFINANECASPKIYNYGTVAELCFIVVVL